MLAQKYKEEFGVLTPVKRLPCVSVVMPFEPKMSSKEVIMHSLKIAADKIKRDLFKNFARDVSDEVLHKLKIMIERLDYTTHKKSVVLFVSPEIEKVYYLDIEVCEKVITDTSFEIRDIIMNKKDERKFLVLVITGKHEKIYYGKRDRLQLIVSNSSKNVERDLPESVANFTDIPTIKEAKLKKFLHYIDNGLRQILKYYPLPLFIVASKKTMGYFRSITKHHKNIVGFVHGNFDDATETELITAVEPQLQNWRAIKQKHLINSLKIAQDDLKLVTGIHDVWMHANRLHKQLLVVERDFYCPAFVTANGKTIFINSNDQKEVITKDAVDDVIEKVLQNGGDVEFVDDLRDYNRIALIELCE
jgi:hypothetical protein